MWLTAYFTSCQLFFVMSKTTLTYINIVRKIDKEREALFFHLQEQECDLNEKCVAENVFDRIDVRTAAGFFDA